MSASLASASNRIVGGGRPVQAGWPGRGGNCAPHDPARTASTIMLRGPATEIFGRTVSLSGRLTLSVGAAPARSRIIITRTLAGSKSDHLLRIGLVNPNGGVSVRYVPSYSTTFTVDFWGNSEYQSAIVKRIVYVRAGARRPVPHPRRLQAGQQGHHQRQRR